MCITGECVCQCPTYGKTTCDFPHGPRDCVEGTHCAPQYEDCVQDVCPEGAIHLGNGDARCECQGGNGVKTIYDSCRSPYIVACVPVTP